jgi:excisionase family DNA binding protein
MTATLVPIEDLARTLTVSVTTVRSWVRTGLIPGDRYVKIGNTYRFDKEAIIDHFRPKKLVTEAVPLPPTPEPQAEPEMKQLEFNFDLLGTLDEFDVIDVDANL